MELYVSIPSAEFIEAASEQLENLDEAVIQRHTTEFKNACPDASDEQLKGYLLGLQTARVFLSTNPNYAQAPIL